MIKFNWLLLFLTSLIPIILAYVWFKPKVYNLIFKDLNQSLFSFRYTPSNIILLFVLGFMYSITLSYQVIHQLHIQSLLMNEVGFLKGEGNAYKDLIYIFELYGKNFRSFKHGAFHGLLNSIFIVLPILVYSKYTSASSWRSVIFQWMFWMICGVLMGGIICELY
jgi:hypothetical protein